MRLQTRFTHDAVRRGSDVFVASTEGGEVVQYAYANMSEVRTAVLHWGYKQWGRYGEWSFF